MEYKKEQTSISQDNNYFSNEEHLNKKKPTYIKKFIIKKSVIQETKAYLIENGEYYEEGLVFWSGTLIEDIAQINRVICPHSISTSVSSRLSKKGLGNIFEILKENGEFLFAQVHSHPGTAFHSDIDDNEAISFKKGFISVVVPYFGRYMNKLDYCAIFEYVGNSEWKRLSDVDILKRFEIIKDKK